MTQPKGWMKLDRLADEKKCQAAADELYSTDRARCEEVVGLIHNDHGLKLDKQADLLQPGAKRRGQIIAQFRPNPTLVSSSDVLLYVALTKLDKSNGMFSFLTEPEDKSIPQTEWKEEEVILEPGEGVIWRGDCVRRRGEGHGGVMLIARYEKE